MDEHEKFFFDLNGYLVVENALTPEEIAACNKAIDNNPDKMRVRPPEQSLSGESKALKGKHGRTDLGGMLTWPKPWCQPFRDLLAHPNIVPYLAELLREDCRLDHLYGIVMEKGAEGHVMHGGGTADDLTHFYQFHNGRMRCGLTVVSWILTDCNPGEGGFACIPAATNPITKHPAMSHFSTGIWVSYNRSRQKRDRPSSSQKHSHMARSPGQPTINADPFSTNTRPAH